MSFTTGQAVTIDGRPALRFVRDLPHAPERVWRAVTEPSELAQWFVAPVAWGPALGETWEVMGHHGEIVELDPPRRIAWTFGTERYWFDVTPLGDGTRLEFVHVIAAEMPQAQTAAGWESYLDRLSALVDDAPLSETDAHDAVGAYHEAHAAAMGVDAAPGRRFVARLGFRRFMLEDGPRLRLERRFPVSPERLWAMVSDPADLAHWWPDDLAERVVVHEDAPRAVDVTWHGEPLRFEVHPDPIGSRLVMTHAFADRDTAARTAAGWDRCLARFEARLGGVELGVRESLELWPELHEAYAEQYGVSLEPGLRAYAEHPLT